jgi:hypothetical protein
MTANALIDISDELGFFWTYLAQFGKLQPSPRSPATTQDRSTLGDYSSRVFQNETGRARYVRRGCQRADRM